MFDYSYNYNILFANVPMYMYKFIYIAIYIVCYNILNSVRGIVYYLYYMYDE